MSKPTPVKIEGELIQVGLSWDPNQVVTTIDRVKNLMGQNKVTFDLDIACYSYAADNSFLNYISGVPGEMVDKSGCIKHSGDNRDGVGDGDDEYIVVDLKDAPSYLETLFFVVEVASAHAFGDIIEPTSQVTDKDSGKLFYQTKLSQSGKANNSACIAFKIKRGIVMQEWVIHPIEEFLDHEHIEDWAQTLRSYLDQCFPYLIAFTTSDKSYVLNMVRCRGREA